MPATPKPQPERRKTIQDLYDEAQSRYNVMRAVIDRPDVPAKGKLLLALGFSATFLGIVPLGISRAKPEAYAAVLICTLTIAYIIYRIADPPRRKNVRQWTRPPQPRSRPGNKAKLRSPR